MRARATPWTLSRQVGGVVLQVYLWIWAVLGIVPLFFATIFLFLESPEEKNAVREQLSAYLREAANDQNQVEAAYLHALQDSTANEQEPIYRCAENALIIPEMARAPGLFGIVAKLHGIPYTGGWWYVKLLLQFLQWTSGGHAPPDPDRASFETLAWRFRGAFIALSSWSGSVRFGSGR